MINVGVGVLWFQMVHAGSKWMASKLQFGIKACSGYRCMWRYIPVVEQIS